VLVDYPELTIEDGILNLGHWDLPFDLAQGGGELLEPFEIWFLVLEIFMIFIKQAIFVKSVNYLFK
jgi:hypothetical protein